MTIKILNYRNNCELNYSLVFIFGQVIALDCDQNDQLVVNCRFRGDNHKCSIMRNGKFRFAFLLGRIGANVFEFTYKQESIKLSLVYRRSPVIRRCIKLYYVVCSEQKSDDKKMSSIFEEGRFQSKNSDENRVGNAKRRIGIAMLMLQTFVASILPNRNTFDLELDEHNLPKVELFHSTHGLDEFKQMNQEQIWRSIAVELLELNDTNSNYKYLTFLAFSRYKYDASLTKNPNQIGYDEMIKMTNCFIALGGGGLACLSTCALFCWPERVSEIDDRLNDTTPVDTKLEMNDCGGDNPSTYAGVYSTSLGSTLHELSHILDLGHEKYGIMGRQFELINNYFLNNEIDIKWYNRPSYIILTNHRFLNKNFKYSKEDDGSYAISCVKDEDEEEETGDKLDDRLKVEKSENGRMFSFDKYKANLKSVNGIILVEYRDSSSYTLDFTEFNLAKKALNLSNNKYYKLYKNKQNALNIIVLDSLGYVFKFT